MTRRALALLLGGAMVLTACSDTNDPAGPPTASPDTSESATPSPSAEASASPTEEPTESYSPDPDVSSSPGEKPTPTTTPRASGSEKAFAVYYLGDQNGRVVLHREFRRLKGAETPLRTAAVAAVSLQPLDPDYTNTWPKGTTVRGVDLDGSNAVVDLSKEARNGNVGSEAACATLQQLVWTVTAAVPAVKTVEIRVEGSSRGVVSSWWGVGCGEDKPLRRTTPYYEILAHVQISNPNHGTAVRRELVFGGEATVFEATVSWSVTDLVTKKVLAEGFETASEGAPGRGVWEAKTTLPASAAGHDVELRAWEDSAKDGSDLYVDTKTVRVQ